MVSRAGLEAVVKGKIPSPCQDWNPRSSSPYPRAIRLSYTDSFMSILSMLISTTHVPLGHLRGRFFRNFPTNILYQRFIDIRYNNFDRGCLESVVTRPIIYREEAAKMLNKQTCICVEGCMVLHIEGVGSGFTNSST
jgi:hypothetical protein